MPEPSPDRPGSLPARSSVRLPRHWWNQARRSPHLVALALVAAGALPPIGLAALPGGLSMLGAPRSGVVLVTALLFAPALVGFAVALRGFDAILVRLRAEPGREYRQIIARVLLAALILAYI